MLTYDALSTPLGDILIVDGPHGLLRIAYPDEDRDRVLAEVEGYGLGRPQPGRLPDIHRQLEEYFDGRRTIFDARTDLSHVATPFAERVLRATAAIAFGHTSTYGAVAAKAGAPHGARAAGNALNSNPIPFVIPCHRVILASGKIGGYAGHEDRKAWLLKHEGAL